MMQPTDFGELRDRAQFRRLDRSLVGRILIERKMSSYAVVVREVAGQETAEMVLVEDKDMIQTLAPDGADEPLHEGALPRAVGRRKHFTDPHPLHALPERLAVDGVAIAEEIGRRGLFWEGVDDLLGSPVGGGMFGHAKVENAAAMVGEDDQDEEDAQVRGRNGEEVDRHEVPAMVGEDVRQVCEGGVRRFGISRETLRSATSKPSFRSSPWILGAPHRGLAVAIRAIKVRISASTGGRPTVGRRESVVQWSRKRRRCHRSTVAGVTMTRARLHPAHIRDSPTQKNRSRLRSFGRGTVRLYTAS
jgi:hypothetical protein